MKKRTDESLSQTVSREIAERPAALEAAAVTTTTQTALVTSHLSRVGALTQRVGTWVAWRRKRKNKPLAVGLAFFFGPLGMIYATGIGALVMFIVDYLIFAATATLAGKQLFHSATTFDPIPDLAGVAPTALRVAMGLLGTTLELPAIGLIAGVATLVGLFLVLLPLAVIQCFWASKAVTAHNRDVDAAAGRS